MQDHRGSRPQRARLCYPEIFGTEPRRFSTMTTSSTLFGRTLRHRSFFLLDRVTHFTILLFGGLFHVAFLHALSLHPACHGFLHLHWRTCNCLRRPKLAGGQRTQVGEKTDFCGDGAGGQAAHQSAASNSGCHERVNTGHDYDYLRDACEIRSTATEPVVALVFPVSTGVGVGDEHRCDVLGIFVAQLGRHAQLHRKAVLCRQHLAVVAKRE
jgi:hypothetical protein